MRTMLATAPDKRDAVQRYLAGKFEKELRINADTLKALDPAFKKESEETESLVKTLQSERLPEPKIQALWDRGEPSPTFIYRRGDPLSPGRLVGAGVPTVLTDGKTPFEVKPPWPGAKKTGRRLAFGRWLIRPDHPLEALAETLHPLRRLLKQLLGMQAVEFRIRRHQHLEETIDPLQENHERREHGREQRTRQDLAKDVTAEQAKHESLP